MAKPRKPRLNPAERELAKTMFVCDATLVRNLNNDTARITALGCDDSEVSSATAGCLIRKGVIEFKGIADGCAFYKLTEAGKGAGGD